MHGTANSKACARHLPRRKAVALLGVFPGGRRRARRWSAWPRPPVVACLPPARRGRAWPAPAHARAGRRDRSHAAINPRSRPGCGALHAHRDAEDRSPDAPPGRPHAGGDSQSAISVMQSMLGPNYFGPSGRRALARRPRLLGGQPLRCARCAVGGTASHSTQARAAASSARWTGLASHQRRRVAGSSSVRAASVTHWAPAASAAAAASGSPASRNTSPASSQTVAGSSSQGSVRSASASAARACATAACVSPAASGPRRHAPAAAGPAHHVPRAASSASKAAVAPTGDCGARASASTRRRSASMPLGQAQQRVASSSHDCHGSSALAARRARSAHQEARATNAPPGGSRAKSCARAASGAPRSRCAMALRMA